MSCPLGTIYWGTRPSLGTVVNPTTGALTRIAMQPNGSYSFDSFTGSYWYIAIPSFMNQPRTIQLATSPLMLLPIDDTITLVGVPYHVYRAFIALLPDDLTWVIP